MGRRSGDIEGAFFRADDDLGIHNVSHSLVLDMSVEVKKEGYI